MKRLVLAGLTVVALSAAATAPANALNARFESARQTHLNNDKALSTETHLTQRFEDAREQNLNKLNRRFMDTRREHLNNKLNRRFTDARQEHLNNQ
jgi:hypothetical protein